MAKFTINGKEIESKREETIINAARRAGVKIPHYCWHAGLSVAANCRMCLVDIKGQPKLQPACQFVPADGWVVETDNDRVKEARRAVMEFLLINHPVDCPICDQAGECKLQDYWMKHDRGFSRFPSERDKVHKEKAHAFGPLVIYDAERCIVCTRCVRFCQEIAKDPVLAIGNRGDHAEVIVEEGRELDHPYSLMTADICPVGALTNRDFRFKQRVWFLKDGPTICPGCATGCNSYLDHFRGTAYRLRPRENQDVNQWWMCDEGCLEYKRVNDRRFLSAQAGRGHARAPVPLADGIAAAATALGTVPTGKLAIVLSAQHTVEDNAVLLKIARDYLRATSFFLAGRAPGEADTILRNADKNPNTAGATAVAGGTALGTFADLEKAASSGAVGGVLALGGDAPVLQSPALHKLAVVVVVASNEGPLAATATVILPAATWAESDGTFVNGKNLRQQFSAAMPARGDSLPAWDLLGRLARKMGFAFALGSFAEARAVAEPPSAAAAE